MSEDSSDDTPKLTPDNVTADSIKALREQTSKESLGRKRDVMNSIACCYAVAAAMAKRPKKFAKLRRDDFFNDFYRPPEENDPLLWTLFYSFSAKRGAARDRVMRYGAVLKRYRHEGVKGNRAMERLEEEGGITKAYKKCNQDANPHQKGKSLSEHKQSQSKPDRTGASLLREGDESDQNGAPTKPVRRDTKTEKPYTFEVECSEEQQYKVLTLGDAMLGVEITPAPGRDKDWLRVKLVSVERLS